jgi:hypothetical protein
MRKRWLLAVVLVAGMARAALRGPQLDGELFGIEPVAGSRLIYTDDTDRDTSAFVERRWELTTARSPESLVAFYRHQFGDAIDVRDQRDAYVINWAAAGLRDGERVAITIERSSAHRTSYAIVERFERRRHQHIAAR